MDFDIFGRNVTDKVGNQKTLHYATSNNLCFCTTWQNGETRKSHISLNRIRSFVGHDVTLVCYNSEMFPRSVFVCVCLLLD